MITVIAEKPSVAKEIATILGATNKKNGYYEGNNYSVTWAFGHLVELKDFKSLGFENWELSSLPFIPKEMELRLKDDKGVINQFKIIKTLFESSNSLICATDAGREGELIFRYIYQQTNSKKFFQRLWISSLTDEAIRRGFKNLKNGTDYDSLFYAARSRNEADYLIGLNSTIAMTAKANVGLLSLGRVQTPTLGLICQRYLSNTNFEPIPYFIAQLLVQDSKGSKFKISYENSFDKKETCLKLISTLASLELSKIEEKEIKDSAPLLFDLTLLQRESNNRFGYSAQVTLDTAQALYEKHKVLSYPRTASNYLSEDMYSIIPDLMLMLSKFHSKNDIILDLLKLDLSKKPINNNKITDHHAIIPTEISPNFSSFSETETNIYNLVVNRFIEAFMPECVKESKKYLFAISEGNFTASSIIIKKEGWRAIQKKVIITEEAEEDLQNLPLLKVGDKVNIIEKNTLEKLTKPLPFHTESSLLQLMETAGKLVEDENLKEAMKEGGLGTPATRASMIETLVYRTYIYRDKKKLLPTEKGLQLYNFVKDLDISKPDLTASWEAKLALMEQGNYKEIDFKNEIINSTTDIIESIRKMDTSSFNKKIGLCPKCKSGFSDFGRMYKCEADDKCNFPIIWKTIGGKPITATIVKEIIENNKTGLIKGFKNVDGKIFDAALIYNSIENKLKYDFSKEIVADCPKCDKGKLERGSVFYKCNNIPNCDFIVFSTIAQKKVSETEILKLLKNKRTGLIKGFQSKAGKSFDAFLLLKDDFKIEFEFPIKK